MHDSRTYRSHFCSRPFNHTIFTVWENFRLESRGYVPRSAQGGNGRDFVLDKVRETALQEPLQCHQQRAPTLWPLPPSFLLKSAPCWAANETWPRPISSGQRVLPRSMYLAFASPWAYAPLADLTACADSLVHPCQKEAAEDALQVCGGHRQAHQHILRDDERQSPGGLVP